MKLLLLCLGLMAVGLAAQTPAKLMPVDRSSYPKVIAARHGKVVLANFWATWCVPCRKEMPQLVELSRRLGAR